MVRNYFAIALLVLSLTACAISHKQLDNNPAFSSHQYNNTDMNISWKAERLDNALQINGTVTNARSEYVYENVELEATLLDLQGKVVAKNTYTFTPLKFNGTESFKMTIPLESGMQFERIKFNYRYGMGEDRYSIKFESKP